MIALPHVTVFFGRCLTSAKPQPPPCIPGEVRSWLVLGRSNRHQRPPGKRSSVVKTISSFDRSLIVITVIDSDEVASGGFDDIEREIRRSRPDRQSSANEKRTPYIWNHANQNMQAN